jgi:alcohol dehydrogenase, propanol-preferring
MWTTPSSPWPSNWVPRWWSTPAAKTVRGSIVGTRKDLQEALAFAGEGQVHTVYTEDRLENINSVFARLKAGNVQGRVVMRMAAESGA